MLTPMVSTVVVVIVAAAAAVVVAAWARTDTAAESERWTASKS
jgi:hypothetical protein